jgi:polar amino acid transport system substrate-binding protein
MRALICLAVSLGLAGPAAAETLRIGTDPTFAPYIFHKGDRLTGMDKDVMDEVCRRAALECTWSRATFDALIPALRAGQIDAAIAGMANSPSRRKVVDFSLVYSAASGASYYAGMPGAKPPASARIGVKGGTIHAEHLAAKGRKARGYASEAQALDGLVAGEIDLYFGPNSFLIEARKSDRRGWDILYEEEVASEGAAVALRKGNPALKERVNAALSAMQADGTLRRLNQKWFD